MTTRFTRALLVAVIVAAVILDALVFGGVAHTLDPSLPQMPGQLTPGVDLY